MGFRKNGMEVEMFYYLRCKTFLLDTAGLFQEMFKIFDTNGF